MHIENVLTALGTDNETVIAYFRELGLLRRYIHCEECKEVLHEVNYKRHVDGKAFRCYKSICTNKQKYISIRKNSIFHDFNLDLKTFFKLAYRWFSESNIADIQREFGVSKTLILKVFKTLRERCKNYLLENPVRLGGVGVVCQIDESMFRYKQKYHTGRMPEGERWVFGIVDTSISPATYFVTLVEDRSARTLLPLIAEICRPGSVIWSDEWRAYQGIVNMGFEHQTVNHSLNFVNPVTGVNTQTVESLWNRLKRRLKKLMGLSLESLKNHLVEWMWKDNVGKKNISNLINLMRN
jgi:transposase-like protein